MTLYRYYSGCIFLKREKDGIFKICHCAFVLEDLWAVCDYLRKDFIQPADFAQIHAGNTTALFYYAIYNSANVDQVCFLPSCG